MTIIGFVFLTYAVLAVFAPSAAGIFGLPTLATGTGDTWGAASYWWLISLGASGVLAVITGVRGYVLESSMEGKTDE